MWKLSIEAFKMTPNSEEAVEELKKYSAQNAVNASPHRIMKILREEGYLTIFCQDCMIRLSQEMYEKQGYQIQRVGNMLFDSNFLNSLSEAERESVIKRALEASSG